MANKKKPGKKKLPKVVAKAKAKPDVGGRPTDYRDEFNVQAYKLTLLGAKDKQIAEFFGVSESTINLWKLKHPKFSESMSAGKESADAVIAESLFHRAKGYSHPEVHVSSYEGAITLTPLTKHYPPDTNAASLWLRNRQPALWRDKVDHEISGKDGGLIGVAVMEAPDFDAILKKVDELPVSAAAG